MRNIITTVQFSHTTDMNTAFALALLAFALVEVQACQPTTVSTSTTTATTTTTAAGRRKRDVAGTEVVLNSNVPVAQSQALINKLKTVASRLNLDASRFGNVEQEIGTDASGNAQLYNTLDGNVDCGELRQVTRRIVKQVSEVKDASIYCKGKEYKA